MSLLLNRNAEICYYDKAPRSMIVYRDNYIRNKEFYEAVKQALINLFYATDNTVIVVNYHGLSKSVIYNRKDVLNGIFNTKDLRKRAINNEK